VWNADLLPMRALPKSNERAVAALIGKAGEAFVAAELLRRGVHVAYPAYDGGVDLLAYREHKFNRGVPIQVKARSSTCYNFQKSWFRIERLVLVQIWYVWQTAMNPQFYIFSRFPEHIEDALGKHSASRSWIDKGGFNVTEPSADDIERMQRHRDKWERILDQL